MQNEIQFQHSQKDRLRNYAPQPEDRILFTKVEANRRIEVQPLKANPVIDLPYEFYQVAIPYCDGNLGALPEGYDPVPDSWNSGNQYYPRWKFLPKSKTLVIDRKFTIGVRKNDLQNPVTDSLPARLFLGREFLSYESNILLLRRLLRERAPERIQDSILIEEMVYLDAAADFSPEDAVLHRQIHGGWNLHFQSLGLCYNADVNADHIDYSLLMVPENFMRAVQDAYEFERNLECDQLRWNDYEIKFLRRVGNAFYYRLEVGDDVIIRAKYLHGNVTFSGDRME